MAAINMPDLHILETKQISLKYLRLGNLNPYLCFILVKFTDNCINESNVLLSQIQWIQVLKFAKGIIQISLIIKVLFIFSWTLKFFKTGQMRDLEVDDLYITLDDHLSQSLGCSLEE